MPHAVIDELEVVDVEKKHADLGLVELRLVDGLAQQREQLAAVGQIGQGIAFGEILQLPGALGHLEFEAGLIVLGRGAGDGQFLGHGVEGDGDAVELVDAAAPDTRRGIAPRQCRRSMQQAAHRPHDA